jgi:hypothetical protein
MSGVLFLKNLQALPLWIFQLGFIMSLLEGTYESYLKNRKRKLSFEELTNQIIDIYNKSLLIDDISELEGEILQISSRVITNSPSVIYTEKDYFDNTN